MKETFLAKLQEIGVVQNLARPISLPQIPQENVWYIVVENTQFGPFNEDALKRIVKNSLIKPETLVCRSGMHCWEPAISIPEVNKMFLLATL